MRFFLPAKRRRQLLLPQCIDLLQPRQSGPHITDQMIAGKFDCQRELIILAAVADTQIFTSGGNSLALSSLSCSQPKESSRARGKWWPWPIRACGHPDWIEAGLSAHTTALLRATTIIKSSFIAIYFIYISIWPFWNTKVTKKKKHLKFAGYFLLFITIGEVVLGNWHNRAELMELSSTQVMTVWHEH